MRGEAGETTVELALKVLGGLAGLATVIYLAGGFVLALRLGFEDLPWDAVISSLPREFLISVGVTVIIAPVLVAAVGYVCFRLSRGSRATIPDDSSPSENRRRHLRFIGVTLLVAVLLVIPGGTIELAKDGPRGTLWFYLALAWLISAAWTYAVLWLRAAVARHYKDTAKARPRQWDSPRAVVAMCGVYGLLLLPATIVVGATLPMTDAKACVGDQAEFDGVFVGDTENRLYIGREPDGTGDRRIISLPYDALGEVFIGEGAFEQECEAALVPGA